ncbi:sensory rhodopsin transducer, partial [Candidatus Methylobacter favarea]|uniref:sensory rhodopsin transducer n=1 Tax=Candidatus Methylobacter favarea TaxID=2707345 RepID=UPI00157C450F
MNIGHKRWVIADGYIPPDSTGSSRELVSHEAMCILNCNAQNAHVEVTLYFSDRDPVGPYRFSVKALRTLHVRFNEFTDPEPVPHNTDYASVIESDI